MRPLAEDYQCIEFRAPGGGGGEPRPKPGPKGMDGRPEPSKRMFVQPTVPSEYGPQFVLQVAEVL